MRTARWAATALVALLVLVPLARLAAIGLEGGSALDLLTRPRTARALRHTLEVSLVVTALSTALGAAAALATETSAIPGRRAIRLGLLLPLVVPQFVGAFSWKEAYPALIGPVGVITVLTVVNIPLAYLVVAAALATRVDPQLDRAARVSGAGPWTALRTATLPLLRRPLAAAAALVFVRATDAFAIPAVLGTPAGYSTITTLIYQDLALSSTAQRFTEAVQLSLLLVALVLVVGLIALPATRDRRLTWTLAPGPGRLPARGGRPVAVVLWVYLGLAVAIPLGVLVLTALTRAVGLPPTPDNWTLDNLTTALAGPALDAIGNSLLLATLTTALLLALGGLLTLADRRGIGALPLLTFALPGSVVAVAVLLAYGQWLGGTLLIILLAYLTKLLPLAHRPLASAAKRLAPETVHAARAAGADTLTAVRTIVLPSLRPAVLAAGALVFLTVLRELTISTLLYGPRTQTLAVVLLNLEQLGQVGPAAALAVLLTACTLAIAVPLLRYRGDWP